MSCDEYKDLLMGYLDGELSDECSERVRRHLEHCAGCSEEFEEFRKLKQITDDINLLEPEDKIWDQYWSNLYNRLERGIGWIIFSISAVILLIYGGFKLIECVIKDPAVEITLKLGLIGIIAGVALLLVSIIRERLWFYKKDRYKDVRR